MVNPLNIKSDIIANNTNNNVINISDKNYKGITISFTDLLYINNKLNTPLKTTKKTIKKSKSNFHINIDDKNLFISKDENGEELYTNETDFYVSNDGYLKTQDNNIVQGVKSFKSSVYSTNGDLKFDEDYIEIIDSKVIKNDETNILTVNAKITPYFVSEDLDSKKGKGFKSTYIKQTNIDNLKYAYKEALEVYSQNPVEGQASIKKIVSIDSSDFSMNANIEIILNDSKINHIYENEKSLYNLCDKLCSIIGINSYILEDENTIIIESIIPGIDFNLDSIKINDDIIKESILQESYKGYGLLNLNEIRNSLADAIKDEAGEFLEVKNEIIIDENTNIENLILNLEKLEISNNSFDKIEIEDGIVYLIEDENKFVAGQIITAVKEEENLIEIDENTYKSVNEDYAPSYSIFGLHGSSEYENNDKSLLDTIKKRTLTNNKIQYGYIKNILSSNDYINLNIELRA